MAISVTNTSGTKIITDGATALFYGVTGIQLFLSGNLLDANVAIPVRDAGTFSNLFTYVSQNDVNGNSTVTLFIAGVASTLLTTYGNAQTGIKEDTTHTPSVTASDTASYRILVPSVAGTHTVTFHLVGMQFNPTTTTNCIQLLASVGLAAYTTASTTLYEFLTGGPGNSLNTLATVNYTVVNSFTSSNFYVKVSSSNTRTTTTTLGTEKNSSAGAQSVAYTSGQSGIKEDTTHTDSLVAGDTFCYYVTTGSGTGTFSVQILSSRYVNTDGQFIFYAAETAATNFNVTTYWAVYSSLIANTTEAQVQYYPESAIVTGGLQALVATNTITTSNTIIQLRKNGGNANQLLTIAAGQTGLVQDTTHNDFISAGSGNAINYQIVTPNTSGAIDVSWLSMRTGSSIKTINGLAIGSVKTVKGLAIASMRDWNGLV